MAAMPAGKPSPRNWPRFTALASRTRRSSASFATIFAISCCRSWPIRESRHDRPSGICTAIWSGSMAARPKSRWSRLLEIADRMGIERLCVYMGLPYVKNPKPDRLREENDHGAASHRPLARSGLRLRLCQRRARRGQPGRDRPLRRQWADGRHQAVGRQKGQRPRTRPDHPPGGRTESRHLSAHLVQNERLP